MSPFVPRRSGGGTRKPPLISHKVYRCTRTQRIHVENKSSWDQWLACEETVVDAYVSSLTGLRKRSMLIDIYANQHCCNLYWCKQVAPFGSFILARSIYTPSRMLSISSSSRAPPPSAPNLFQLQFISQTLRKTQNWFHIVQQGV